MDVCAWRDATWLHLQGATVADFLQGYLTSDTTRINAAQVTPMALCTLKGRVLASGWVVAVDDGAALIVHVSLADRVRQFLTPYVNFSKCRFADQPAGAVLLDAGGNIAFNADQRIRLSAEADAALPDGSRMMQAGLIKAGFAFVSAPVSEKYLPQMLGLDKVGAVDFDKGCYLGQEIVARAQHRGEVKRRLVSFTYSGAAPDTGARYNTYDAVIAAAQGVGLAVAVN